MTTQSVGSRVRVACVAGRDLDGTIRDRREYPWGELCLVELDKPPDLPGREQGCYWIPAASLTPAKPRGKS